MILSWDTRAYLAGAIVGAGCLIVVLALGVWAEVAFGVGAVVGAALMWCALRLGARPS